MKVAVVDDDPDMVKMVSFIIGNIDTDITIEKYSDGNRFLQDLKARTIMSDKPETPDIWDCLILDIMMPGISGIDIAKIANPYVPIMFITGLSDVVNITELENYGMVITKPLPLKSTSFILTKWFEAVQNKEL